MKFIYNLQIHLMSPRTYYVTDSSTWINAYAIILHQIIGRLGFASPYIQKG